MVKMQMSKPALFKLSAPAAKRVSIAGTFNNWSIDSNMAKKDAKGTWSLKMNLRPGKYNISFL